VINFTGINYVQAAEPTPNSVTLSWTAPGDDGTTGAAAVYDIRYSTSVITDLNWDLATQVDGEPSPQMAGTTEELTIVGLEPSTVYYFAIKSADEIPNWSVLSNVVSITTSDEDVAPAVVANLTTGTITTSSIVLNWSAPGDDSLTGNATAYDIRYSTSTITDLNWASALQASGEPIPGSPGSSETFTVTGLNDNTTYYFAIKTADEVPNWSGLSNIASATTELEITVPAPPILASPSNGATDVDQPIAFDWSDVSDADSYQIQIDNNSGITSPLKDTVTSLSAFAISGLTESLTFYWRVRSHNSAGWGSWTSIYNFTTSCTLPGVPVAVSPLNGATRLGLPVSLNWNDAAGATQYQVQIDDNSNFGTPVISTNVALSEYVASGLDDNQQYYWRIRAGNDCGWSNYTATFSFTTADTTPPAGIFDLSAETGSGGGEVYLEWTASGDDGTNGAASAYMIRYSQELITDDNWDQAAIYEAIVTPLAYGQTQSIYMTGLNDGEAYYFGVKAYDESINSSDMSNIASCISGIDISLALDDNVTEPVSPGSGTVIHSSRPELIVANIETGEDNYYYFEIASDSFFINIAAVSGPISEQDGEVTGWRPSAALESNRDYYWRVRINDNEYCTTSNFELKATAHAFPNPVNLAETNTIAFRDIPEGADVVLMTVSGSTIQQWSNVTDDNLTWDGTNQSGNRVSSGTYLWFVEGTDLQGKIIVLQ
ncbi:MAG: fibronectin type III domain-containing protein, partial [Candidatus Zixiibacteriota bacterium]